MAFTISNLLNYFQSSQRPITRGEKHVSSGHVINFSYDRGHLTGRVQASMKKIHYDVQIELDENKAIKQALCGCPKGLDKCSHMAAVYITAMKTVSPTDLPCSWKKSKKKAATRPIKAQKQFSVLTRSVTQDDRDFMREEINQYSNFTGMKFLLNSESIEPIIHYPIIQNVLKKCFAECQFITLETIISEMKLSSDTIQDIAMKTTGQAKNELWHSLRYGRITASKFGKFIQARKITNSIVKNVLSKSDLTKVVSIKWGIDREQTAVEEFQRKTGLTVKPAGLFLTKSGMLGASPDGLIEDHAVLEVKCPYNRRDKFVIQSITKDFYLYLDEEELKLKENHPYYHQVQGQLHITGRNLCYFVVYTSVDIQVIRIFKDPLWLKNLENIYMKHVLPTLIQENCDGDSIYSVTPEDEQIEHVTLNISSN